MSSYDSHIIPEALTRPSVRGSPLLQYGDGAHPTRRWSSWYDPQLVTAEGEKYLSDLDTWAIAQLREHKLVWSGWGTETDLGMHHTPINNIFGIRKIEGIDTKRLRLFFLSLLWRAAASSRYEFKEISVTPKGPRNASSSNSRARRAAIRLLSRPAHPTIHEGCHA